MSKATSKQTAIGEISALRNLGPKSAEMLYQFGIRSAQELLNADAYQLYEDLCAFSATPVSRNLLRAILGAQEDKAFIDVVLRDPA